MCALPPALAAALPAASAALPAASAHVMARGARGKWTLGECRQDGKVFWREFEGEASARLAFQERTSYSSMVMFNPEGVADMFSCVDKEGVDGALLLQAYEGGLADSPDRAGVSALVAEGKAPFVPPSRSGVKQQLMKWTMQLTFNRVTVRHFGCAPLRNASLCYFQGDAVQGYVALTLDDAPCRFAPRSSRVRVVQELLDRYQAHATFMVIGSFLENHPGHRDDLVGLLKAGHELGNHCRMDRSYESDSAEDFERAVDSTSARIVEVQRAAGVEEAVRWFRAPHGRYTQTMHDALQRRGLTNVMCDTYASCPVVQDGDFLGRFLARKALDGGIILLHMPERGHREWCLEGLERLLEGLQRRNLRAVTVGELHRLASGAAAADPAGRNEEGGPVAVGR